MRENTFDVPAYKFLVLKIDDGKKSHTYDEYREYLQSYINYNNYRIYIPFENIDGLAVKEVRGLLKTKEIMIVTAIDFNNSIGIVNSYYLPEEFLDDKEMERIDKVIEENMSEDYINYDDFHKKIARCFFERYQDISYKKTKKRIRKLERKGKIYNFLLN